MSRTVNALQAQRTTISILLVMLIIASCFLVLLWWGWKSAPRDIRISIPPDLRAGAVVKPDEFNAATVFGFTSLYFKELNRWPEDGQVDYPAKIDQFQHYMTPKFYKEIIAVMNRKAASGELQGRERYVLDVDGYGTYEAASVESLDDGSWAVTLRLEVVERLASLEVKRVTIEYPLHVVRMNVSPDRNIFGLALNGLVPGREERKL